jgi:hypothetical protein
MATEADNYVLLDLSIMTQIQNCFVQENCITIFFIHHAACDNIVNYVPDVVLHNTWDTMLQRREVTSYSMLSDYVCMK